MIMPEAVERILEFEKGHQEFLLSAKCDDFHIYPLVRWQLYSALLQALTSHQKPHGSSQHDTRWMITLMKVLISGFLRYNPFTIRSRDLLVFSNSALRRRIVNGKYYDVIYDPLLSSVSDSKILVEAGFLGKHKNPVFTESYAISEPISYCSRFVKLNHSRSIIKLVDAYLNRLRLLADSTFKVATGVIRSKSVLLALKKLAITRSLLAKISPRVVFFHCGSYGGADALLIKLCKEMGIVTAEFQHGYVDKYHLAYNYSFNGGDYSSYVPDYFLTSGQYWRDQLTRFPNRTVVIGNPELKFQLSKRQDVRTREEVLIVSQGTVTSRLVNLTKELRKLLPSEIKLVYRLHPGEVLFEDRYSCLNSIDGITVDKESNIFDLIKRSRAVVGFDSTTLFEALAFQKPVYLMEHAGSDTYIPQELGRRFSSATELGDLITSDPIDRHEDNWKYYWELDWEPRFKDFMSMVGLK